MEPSEEPQRDVTRFAEYIPLEDNTGFQLPDGTTYIYSPNGGWTDEYGFHYNQNEFLELRFQEYALLENELGFVTKDGSVFYFNENGGWEDEEGNMFDCNGKLIGKNDQKEQDAEIENQEENEELEQEWEDYEGVEGDGEEEGETGEQEEESKQEEKKIDSQLGFEDLSITELRERACVFEPKKYVPVHFYFSNVKTKKNDLLNFFREGHEKNKQYFLADILFDYFENSGDQKNKKKTGYGILQCMNQYTALVCIQRHNQKFQNCEIKLFVESIEEYEKCLDIYNQIYDQYNLSDNQREYVVKYDPEKK